VVDIKTILVPTDFSQSSQQAVEMASLIARGQQAKLVFVHVLDLPVTYSESPLVYTFAAEEVAAAERDLAEIVPSEPGIACERKLLKGETASSILDAAEEVHADLIVVGTHGRTGALHILLGSVAEKVLRHARCPVMAVKGLPSHSGQISAKAEEPLPR
jgi:nucleotide-binding universal stress UspA family protein